MKKLSLLICLFLGAGILKSQVVLGSQATDFSVSSVTGQQINLFNILAQDKVVILCFFNAASEQNWQYHQSGVLQQLYAVHGPSGSKDLEILMIESNPATNDACILGSNNCSSTTQGNWLTGVTFPIINSTQVGVDYGVVYNPCIYVICPTKRSFQLRSYEAIYLWEEAKKCPIAIPSGERDLALSELKYQKQCEETCGPVTIAPTVLLNNIGTLPLTSATVELKLNDQLVQTIFWTGNLAKNEYTELQFDSLTIPPTGKLSVTSDFPFDAQPINNSVEYAFRLGANFDSSTMRFRVRTDNFGNETYWEIWDSYGSVLYKGGNSLIGPNGGGVWLPPDNNGPNSYGNSQTIERAIILPGPGCYTLLMVDSRGDGMNSGFGPGSYKLFPSGDFVTDPTLEGGKFGAYIHRRFTVGGIVSTHHTGITPLHFDIAPNPATDIITFDLALLEAKNFSVEVLNTLGMRMPSASAQFDNQVQANWSTNVANWNAGQYQVVVRTDAGSIVKTFVVTH